MSRIIENLRTREPSDVGNEAAACEIERLTAELSEERTEIAILRARLRGQKHEKDNDFREENEIDVAELKAELEETRERLDRYDRHSESGETLGGLIDRAEQAELEKARTPQIATWCPSCGGETLFIGTGGHLTCSVIGCRQPSVERCVAELYNERSQLERELTASRQECEGLRKRVKEITDEAASEHTLVEHYRSQVTELSAQVAVVLPLLQEIYDWTNAKHTPWAEKTKEALSNLPEQSLKLLAVKS